MQTSAEIDVDRLTEEDPKHTQPASDLRQRRTLKTYRPMQKRFAGIKPNCAVRNPIMQMTTLLTAARIQPSQQRRPTKIVETIVSMQDRKSSLINTAASLNISMPQPGPLGCNPAQNGVTKGIA